MGERTLRTTVLAVLLISSAARADGTMEPDDLPPPRPEVATHEAKVDPPAVPAFELPAVEPGFHRPRELRLHGAPLQGTEIVVKGYVTSIYDCAAALAPAAPRMSRAEILQSTDEDPRQCERPRFYLGDTKTTSREASIWVVDVPRRPAKPEREAMSPAELAAWPAVPRLAVGDHMTVTGTWAIRSPHNERNTGGLLVYKALQHTAPPPTAPPTAARIAAPASATPSAPPGPNIAVVTKPPLRPYVDRSVRNASVDHLNRCSQAIAAGQYDAGIAACEAATRTWSGNHLAWYAAASAHMARRAWPAAVAAVERAVALRPDQGMYQLYLGISLYEAEQERVERAAQERDQPEAVMTEPPVQRLDAARDALLRAIELAPDLWRAHYYLGRVYRDLDDSRRAAEQFTRTIATHPAYRFGYIALVELYRRWDYVDEAIAVAMLGTASVPAAEVGELWYEAGMSYDAKRADDRAIEAFGKAIAGKPGDIRSKFQRGQVYFRKGDFANASRDLEDVVSSPDPQIAAVKSIAQQLLDQIERRQHPTNASSARSCGRGLPGCTMDDRGVGDDRH